MVTEYGAGTRSGSVSFIDAVFENMPEELVVGLHEGMKLKGGRVKVGKNGWGDKIRSSAFFASTTNFSELRDRYAFRHRPPIVENHHPLRQLTYLLLLWLLLGCGTADSVPPIARTSALPGVYYWKTDFSFGQADRQAALDNGIKQIYLRVFDVEWSPSRGEAIPLAPVRLPDWDEPRLALADLSVVPVVYLTQEVFRKIQDPHALADRIGKALAQFEETLIEGSVATAYGYHNELPFDSIQQRREKEIAAMREASRRWQIDYDWSPTTREAYFAFLRRLGERYPEKEISVSVRLHQYRERTQNGIPPVPHGLLMCYNMAPVQEATTRDAIFDLKLLEGYLKAPPYPIALDAALPVFSWGAAFHGDRFVDIISDFTYQEAAFNGGVFQTEEDESTVVQQDTTLSATFLRAGDRIRLDGANTVAELRGAADLLSSRADIKDLHFFDWRPGFYSTYEVPSILQAFYKK